MNETVISMQKYIVRSALLPALCLCAMTPVFAGPSYEVQCDDPARDTMLYMFDANPVNGLMALEGTHHRLPDGLNTFSLNTRGEVLKLEVMRYQPYEVELKINAMDGEASVIAASSAQGQTIGTLARILIENHSEIEISDPPRHAAVVLTLASGLSLRFNQCIIRGDTSVLNWSGTFDRES